jgi:putative transposase
MPRQPRLDAPGALHHVMGRGIERTNIFRTDADREDFVNRLANLCLEGSLVVYAWSLLSNHFHLLVRTGRQSISRSMKKLLTGYVVNFNLRHKRSGHLFQNRYKSIICEEDPYLLELTRYIHLNPVRAGMVRDVKQLSAYRWSGHAAILGRVKRPWQDIHTILAYFGKGKKAVEKY